MIRKHLEYRSVAVIDAIFAFGVLVACVKPIRQTVSALYAQNSQIRTADALFAIAFIFFWHYCFSSLNLYDTFATVPSRMRSTLKGVLMMMILILIYFFFIHRSPLSLRSVIVLFWALFCFESIRITLSVYLLDLLAGRDPQRAIIVGSGRRANKAWRSIRTRYHKSITMLGFIDDRDVDEMPPEVACRYLGSIDQLNRVLLNEVVDIILIAMPIQSCYPLMQRVVHIAESVGVQVIYLNDIYSSQRPTEDPNQSIFRELAPQQERYLIRLFVKRVVDICFSAVGLVVLSPVLLCIAIAIKLTSRGPALFKQQRYGRRRRLFLILKFRTMVHNAEELLPKLEHLNEARGPIFKMRHDPRVTKVGKFLRMTSLDELPQLWNVLIGEMSLVGPRPMSVRDVSLFSDAVLMRRFSVMPGMTGLWQVSGRSEVGFDQWITMDTRYIDNWSLSMDLGILVRTLGIIFKRSGAM